MTAPAHPPDLGTAQDWRGEGVEVGRPVGLADGRTATLLSRRVADDRQVVLALAAGDGRITDIVPIATVEIGGVRRREVLTALEPFAVGRATLLRADVRLFELAAPRFFAVKAVLISIDGRPQVVLERLVESGNDVRDRRATFSASDVDGDGVSEILVEERESGVREPRKLVYRRSPDGAYTTGDPSLFAE
jgi:hypothetical protein